MLSQIAPYILFAFYKLLQWSWRIEIFESPGLKQLVADKKSFVIAHWHGDELGILHLLKAYHVSCIISTSKDGDLMNRIVELLGAETVRGSSTRGGTQALKGIIQLVKKGRRPSVAVDGPKGPIYQVKPGVLQISRLTALPIVPISFAASRTYVFTKAWNKTQLPLPFAKVKIVWGDPLPPVERNADPKAEEPAIQLANGINAVKLRANLMAAESQAF